MTTILLSGNVGKLISERSALPCWHCRPAVSQPADPSATEWPTGASASLPPTLAAGSPCHHQLAHCHGDDVGTPSLTGTTPLLPPSRLCWGFAENQMFNSSITQLWLCWCCCNIDSGDSSYWFWWFDMEFGDSTEEYCPRTIQELRILVTVSHPEHLSINLAPNTSPPTLHPEHLVPNTSSWTPVPKHLISPGVCLQCPPLQRWRHPDQRHLAAPGGTGGSLTAQPGQSRHEVGGQFPWSSRHHLQEESEPKSNYGKLVIAFLSATPL